MPLLLPSSSRVLSCRCSSVPLRVGAGRGDTLRLEGPADSMRSTYGADSGTGMGAAGKLPLRRSPSEGMEMFESRIISSNVLPKSSVWMTSTDSDMRVDGENDKRTLRSASPNTFDCDAHDSEERWSIAQSCVKLSMSMSETTSTFAQSSGGFVLLFSASPLSVVGLSPSPSPSCWPLHEPRETKMRALERWRIRTTWSASVFLTWSTSNWSVVNRAMSQRGTRKRDAVPQFRIRFGAVALLESRSEAVGTT